MAYEPRKLSRHTARYNSANDDNTILFQLVRDGQKVAPTSATVTIYGPGDQSTAVLAATAMTVTGTLMTYAVDTTTVADFPAGKGYRARIIVTVGAITHDSDVYFDVSKNVPFGALGEDQLIAMDSRIGKMENGDSDPDFSEVINAAWSEAEFDIETRQVEGDQMKDSMVVDRVRFSVAVRHLVLAMILRPKGLVVDAEYHEAKYGTKMEQLLTGLPHDVNEDQEEDSDVTNALTCRLGQ